MASQAVAAQASSRPSQKMHEDLELRILMERLNLLESQRELAAIRCQRFTDMLEASLAQSQSQAREQSQAQSQGEEAQEACYWSQPCSSPGRVQQSLDSDSDVTIGSSDVFGADAYYAPRSSRRSQRTHRHRRSSRRHSVDF